MQSKLELQQDLQLIALLQRDLNLVTAFLLLTGQISIVGIFINPGDFNLSLSGPIFGRARLESKFSNEPFINTVIDIIDVIIAVLLIIDEIQVIGAFIGPRRFSIVVSGPIFGSRRHVPTLPCLKREYKFYKKIVTKYFAVDPTVFRNI
ncbi:hypothetical protein F7731_20605 [Cytobacillus depressus]|uniref:Uncharacterized protein n=1 Tax=Cytobacillus depressus TaxID=1602942 RepID=A0A6L3V233_9BACI|nr:hypothetical protein F7731_20605 [Cytobacillus depressus]